MTRKLGQMPYKLSLMIQCCFAFPVGSQTRSLLFSMFNYFFNLFIVYFKLSPMVIYIPKNERKAGNKGSFSKMAL